jgi:23S rRNA pseudouridine1911/1915/1917 synthase
VTRHRLAVPATAAGRRLDRWLAAALPELSRAKLQALIEGGRVRVNGARRKAAHRLGGGEAIEVDVPPPASAELEPEPLALQILHEDDHVLVVNKPAGMVVHPGAGHARGTLAAAVLAHAPTTEGVGGPRRPGIVHRLDKGTSGVLVIAKTPAAYDDLTRQLVARTVTRRYVAILHGRLGPATGVVDAPIGRDPRHRQRMAIVRGGRRALTRYRVLERFAAFTCVEARLETGRTHQIRVHMASLGHPVVGDDTYARGKGRPPVPLEGLALHAGELAFVHPFTHEPVRFSAPLPPRLEGLLAYLRQ